LMAVRLIPLLALLVTTVALRFSPVDVMVSRSVFDPALAQPWKWAWQMPWSLLYDYGVWPAWILAGGGGLCLAADALRRRFGRLGRAGLFLVLVTSLGPGLLVNLVLKPWYGRPRPRDLAEFGGAHEFVPVLTHSRSANCTSFPSGHAAMAFCLFTPAFLFRQRSRTATVMFTAIGLLSGTAVGAARILQGAHFVSDVVWSAGVVYITALVLSRALKLDELPHESVTAALVPGKSAAAFPS